MNIKTTAKTLRAMLDVASDDNDARYALRGIYLDCERRVMVATNGHALVVVGMNTSDEGGGPSGIIERTSLETALKGTKGLVYLDTRTNVANVYLGQRQWEQRPYQLIDSRFPDYAKIVPATCTGKLAQYDPALIGAIAKVLQSARLEIDGKAAPRPPQIVHNGLKAALVVHEQVPTAFGIVMPFREGSTANELHATFINATK